MTSTQALSPDLRQAWVKRWNQDLEGAMLDLGKIQVDRSWAELGPEGLKASRSVDRLEASLLKASLLRHQGRRDQARRVIREIHAVWNNTLLPRNFRLSFEMGQCAYDEGDYVSALDHYVLAQAQARDAFEEVFALTNILFCLESLGAPRAKIEARLRERLASPELQSQAESARHVLQQWDAYLMRKELFSGNVRACLRIGSRTEGQGVHYSQWVASLPFTTSYIRSEDRGEVLSPGQLWQGGYRSRTLRGLASTHQDQISRLSDRIDRFYLWVWQWMCAQNRIGPDSLRTVLASVSSEAAIQEESIENRLLFRNAVSWILLFEPALAHRLERALSVTRGLDDREYPLLQFEYALIQCLQSLRGQADQGKKIPEDSLRLLKNHPLWCSSEIQLRSILLALTGKVGKLHPPIVELVRHLKSRLGHDRKSAPAAIVVDLAMQTVSIAAKKQKIVSEPLARAIALLRARGALPVAEFAAEVFGLREYDSTIHARKLYNLIARVKTLLGDKIRISVRGDVLSSDGQWPTIEIRRPDPLYLALSPGMEAPRGASRDVAPTLARRRKGAHLVSALKALERFTREDVERVLGVSRATACRMIDQWIDQAHILRTGHARATVYIVKSEKP